MPVIAWSRAWSMLSALSTDISTDLLPKRSSHCAAGQGIAPIILYTRAGRGQVLWQDSNLVWADDFIPAGLARIHEFSSAFGRSERSLDSRPSRRHALRWKLGCQTSRLHGLKVSRGSHQHGALHPVASKASSEVLGALKLDSWRGSSQCLRTAWGQPCWKVGD